MKKFILLFPVLLVLLCALPARVTASAAAQGEYAVAASRGVWFYSAENEEGKLFLLPYTYCVRVTARGEEFCAVEYGEDGEDTCTIAGYCRTDQISFLDFVPDRPFLRKTVEITYGAEVPVSPFGSGAFQSVTVTFSYYGVRYADGKPSLYLYGKDPKTGEYIFEYVAAEAEPVYELNEGYLPGPADPSEEPAAAQSGGGLSAVHIVAICIGCVAVVGVAVLLLRGKSAPREEATDF